MPSHTIWKYTVPIEDEAVVKIHSPALIVNVTGSPTNRRALVVYAIVEPGAEEIERRLSVRGTGHPLGDVGAHIATVNADPFVWHVFEPAPKPRGLKRRLDVAAPDSTLAEVIGESRSFEDEWIVTTFTAEVVNGAITLPPPHTYYSEGGTALVIIAGKERMIQRQVRFSRGVSLTLSDLGMTGRAVVIVRGDSLEGWVRFDA